MVAISVEMVCKSYGEMKAELLEDKLMDIFMTF